MDVWRKRLGIKDETGGFFSLNTQTGKLAPKFVADFGDYPSDTLVYLAYMLAYLAYSVFIIINPPKKKQKKAFFKLCLKTVVSLHLSDTLGCF